MKCHNHIINLSDRRVTVKEFRAEFPACLQIVVNLAEKRAQFQEYVFLAYELVGNVIMKVNNMMM